MKVTIRDQINANLDGMGPTQLRKVLRYAQDVRRETHPDEGKRDVPVRVASDKPPSDPRSRVAWLKDQPVGTHLRFAYGTFASTRALDNMARAVGDKGWYEINPTSTGQTIKKVK